MRAINAKQLREWLAKVPDDTILLVPAPDHSYRPATVTKGKALFYKGGHISEDWDQEEAAEIETGTRREVLIVQ
jgi:hypothetical protein